MTIYEGRFEIILQVDTTRTPTQLRNALVNGRNVTAALQALRADQVTPLASWANQVVLTALQSVGIRDAMKALGRAQVQKDGGGATSITNWHYHGPRWSSIPDNSQSFSLDDGLPPDDVGP